MASVSQVAMHRSRHILVVFVAFAVVDEILLIKFDSYRVIAGSLVNCASNVNVLYILTANERSRQGTVCQIRVPFILGL